MQDGTRTTYIRHTVNITTNYLEELRNSSRPGRIAASLGHTPKHPVILIPGFVTSGLEVWQGRPCASEKFRQRIWGSLNMMQVGVENACVACVRMRRCALQ